MIEKNMKRVVDGIEREIIIEIDNGMNKVEFYENEELQMIIDIPEDVTNLEKSKFKKRKYSVIFDYYLDRGILDLSYKDIMSMINTQRIKCSVDFVFHNKNGIKIDAETIVEDEYRFSIEFFTASYLETINGVLFKVSSIWDTNSTYRQLNELDKPDKIGMGFIWQRSISCDVNWSQPGEVYCTIWVNDIPYSMPEVIYNRINNDEYLNNRHFFEDGGTLFDITKEQNRLLAKNNMLKKQQNFIKYIDFDGTVTVE